jgi:hypothetical protein
VSAQSANASETQTKNDLDACHEYRKRLEQDHHDRGENGKKSVMKNAMENATTSADDARCHHLAMMMGARVLRDKQPQRKQ